MNTETMMSEIFSDIKNITKIYKEEKNNIALQSKNCNTVIWLGNQPVPDKPNIKDTKRYKLLQNRSL